MELVRQVDQEDGENPASSNFCTQLPCLPLVSCVRSVEEGSLKACALPERDGSSWGRGWGGSQGQSAHPGAELLSSRRVGRGGELATDNERSLISN